MRNLNFKLFIFGACLFLFGNIAYADGNSTAISIEPEEKLTILSDDVSENGIASAYKNLKFYVNNIGSIRNSKWILIRPMKDGTMKQIILSENSLECTIPAIDNENLYRININGDIDCKLQFECDWDNQHIEAAPFSLHLELRPYIETACISKIEPRNGKPAYDAYYTVQYRGSEKIRVSVEEEYGSSINTQIINEPYIVNGVVENITSPYYAWIDFLVENEYGSSLYTIELGPYGEVLNSGNSIGREDRQNGTSLVNSLNIREYEYRVFNILGNNVGIFHDIDEFYKNANGGMYIIKQFIGNKCVNTKKVIVN